MRPDWFREFLGPCWCDPDREDLFNVDCPIHGLPRSVLRWANGMRAHR